MEIFKIILKGIYYLTSMFMTIYGAYYILTGLFAFKKKKEIRKYKAKNKLAILIAARNEEEVIGNLIDSLHKQKYPKELFDIYVIPNNCTDNTRQVSIDAKAKIIDCTKEVKSKGEVLKYAFEYFDDNKLKYDAYAIFDADNVVHNNFLSRMNDTLCEGYKVAQGFRDSKNPTNSWISNCYTLYYLIQNLFFNRARMNINWSASINGTGFVIAKSVLDEFGFNTVTMTEDIEFTALCSLNNIRIAYVDDAITYDEQPLTFKESWKQRTRWSMGTLQCLYTYSIQLLIKCVKEKRLQCLDMAIFFLAPIAQILSALLLALFMLDNLMSIRVSSALMFVLKNSIIVALTSYFISMLITLIVIKIQNKSFKKSLKGIFTLSVFMVSWIPINMLCLYKKEHVWESIKHTSKVNIEEIN